MTKDQFRAMVEEMSNLVIRFAVSTNELRRWDPILAQKCLDQLTANQEIRDYCKKKLER